MYKLYSALIGFLLAIMIAFNGMLSSNLGNNLALVIIHSVGLFLITFILIVSKKKIVFLRNIPMYLYTAGFIGVFTVAFTNMSYNNIGASVTFALSLLGQSIASIAVDHYGLLGMKAIKFKKEKLVGLVLISLGIAVMMLF